LFVAWGAFALLRGRNAGILAAREFAVNYYSSVFILLVSVVSTRKGLNRLWAAILAGTLVAVGVVIFRIISGQASVTSTGVMRYHAPIAVGASALLFWGLARPARGVLAKLASYFFAIVAGLVIVVGTQHRSAAVALVSVLSLWVIWFSRFRGNGAVGSPHAAVLVALTGVAAVGVLPGVAVGTLERLTTIGTRFEEFNAAWRLLYWKLVLNGALASPVLGHGFGDNLPIFNFRGNTYGADPMTQAGVHNSFLFIFYKEGAIGLLLITVFICLVATRVWRSPRPVQKAGRLWGAAAATCAFLFTSVFACFNVVLEGPFMGTLFWMFAALVELEWRLALHPVRPLGGPLDGG
jgi:O-antigen ligase